MGERTEAQDPGTSPQISDEEDSDVRDLSWFQAVRRVLSNRNWTIYLGTVWIYSSMVILQQYFSLYFRDIGIDYVMVGVFLALMFIVRMVGSFVAGYLADNYDRRKLSVVTMLVMGFGFFIMAFTTEPIILAFAMIIIGLSSFTGTAGQAYSMEQVDRRLGGVANSLFTLGTSLGLVPLFVFSVMFGLNYEFIFIMQVMLFSAAVLYFVAASIRAFALVSFEVPKRKEAPSGLLRDFISENIRGLKLLFRVFPVFIVVLCLDAFSDSFYRFASTYFINETLNFEIYEINMMFLITLAFSVPLALYLGRVFDKRGGQRLTIIVYSIMPVAIFLLLLAQEIPYIAPPEWLTAADAAAPGLSIIFSLAFIATAIKQINDILWYTVLGTYILKSLPRPDLGKMLSLTMVIVMAFLTIGPIPAGFIYTHWQGVPLLMTTLFLNIVILILLMAKSIEPRVSVEELENETTSEQATSKP